MSEVEWLSPVQKHAIRVQSPIERISKSMALIDVSAILHKGPKIVNKNGHELARRGQ
ncbi:MAG: hypothetical protein AAB641_01880 [Patescibacteria group bacterium]